MPKPFIKINVEDLEYAKDFFENVADYSLWLFAVTEYYQGREVVIKKKLVKKYFNNYKKTMNIVIEAKKYGQEGYKKKTENQLVKVDTLKGGVKDTLAVNNKVINNKENIYRSFDNLSLSKDEYNKLLTDYTKQQIDDILDDIENYKDNKKFKSLYLTAKKWLKKNEPKQPTKINYDDLDPLVKKAIELGYEKDPRKC